MSPTIAFATTQKHWYKPPSNVVRTFFPRTTSSSNANDSVVGRGGDVHATANAVFSLTDKEEEMTLLCTTRAYLPQHHPRHHTCWPFKNHHRATDSTSDCRSAGDTDHGKDVCQRPDDCLPRIIKPRKRRKKDRKALAAVPSTTGDLANITCNVTAKCATTVNEPCWPLSLPGRTMLQSTPAHESGSRLHKFECTPASDLHWNVFTDEGCSQNTNVGSLSLDEPYLHIAQSPATPTASVFCNCKYCDPDSDVWDIRQRCFSPTLLPLDTLQRGTSTSKSSCGCSNTINLRRTASEPTSSKPFTSLVVTRVRSFSSSCDTANSQNLLVSSQIVTSHNGHRDIEVKFFSAADSSRL